DKDKVRRERTDWHNVVVWGKRGEALSKILSKGSSIFIEGSLRTSSYDDKEGNKRYKTEVIANNVILAGGRGPGAGADDGGLEAPSDRAARGGGYNRGGGGGGRTPPHHDEGGGGGGDDFGGGGGYGGGNDDDIPF